jgi:hypothetical protein
MGMLLLLLRDGSSLLVETVVSICCLLSLVSFLSLSLNFSIFHFFLHCHFAFYPGAIPSFAKSFITSFEILPSAPLPCLFETL